MCQVRSYHESSQFLWRSSSEDEEPKEFQDSDNSEEAVGGSDTADDIDTNETTY